MPSENDPPNFPAGLDIRPLATCTFENDARFDSIAQAEAIQVYGIAGRIWEASHAVLAYLDPSSKLTRSSTHEIEYDPPPFTRHTSRARPITVIELGSGNGFVAARAMRWLRLGLDLLVATDLPGVCPLLETNLELCASTVRVRPLAWGCSEHVEAILQELSGRSHPDPDPRETDAEWPVGRLGQPRTVTHVLCSDLIYFPELLAPLLRSLLHLTSPPPPDCKRGRAAGTYQWEAPSVIISYTIRSLTKETPFWNAFGLWFDFVPVLAREKPPKGDDPDVAIDGWTRFSLGRELDETLVFVAMRRPESLSWMIPDEDRALLSGAGANGSDSPKSDDQFEQLLLMGMGT